MFILSSNIFYVERENGLMNVKYLREKTNLSVNSKQDSVSWIQLWISVFGTDLLGMQG